MITDKNIGFIGLGNLGSKIANSILEGGYSLYIYDLDKSKGKDLLVKGAVFSTSIQELVMTSTIVITCLPSPLAIAQVIESTNGVLANINENHLWIEMSTTDEQEMLRLSNLLKLKKAEILEAPVTGGQHRAATGNISVLASGERYNFERALPILSEIGYKILFCGKLGNASTLKVVTNFLASTNLLSIGEALMVSKKYGIDLEIAYQAIKISSGNSFVHETESKVILSGSYNVGFTMDLVCKDVGLFNKLANKLRIKAQVSNLIVKIFEIGLKKFGNKSFSTSIVKLLENDCNEKLRASKFPKQLIDYEIRKKGFEIKF